MTTAGAKYLLAIPLLYFLGVFGLDASGLVGPDEPRYASIAREMAVSGDWITPRLWGEPWFEKPPLLYWLGALGFRTGLGPEIAPRLPVALTSIAFLIFYFAFLRGEFGEKPAFYSTLILATSAGWVAFSHAAVPDLPLAAAFGASMLLGLRWLRCGCRGALVASGVLLGLAILAKGLAPLVLASPLFWMGRRHRGALALLVGIAIAVAAPWYLAVTLRHGSAFLNEFVWKHHFERFTTGSLQHVRPFWFFIPVLLAGVFPWTPLLFSLFRRGAPDRSRKFLGALVILCFVFFSASTNKLPGYVLPLLPPLCALFGLTLAERARAVKILPVCAALLGFIPTLGALLPVSIASGLSRAEWAVGWPGIASGLALAALVWVMGTRGRTMAAFSLVAASAFFGVIYLKIESLPAVDRVASARSLWIEIAPRASNTCVGEVNRNWRYGLNYYSEAPLPDCDSGAEQVQVLQQPRSRPRIVLPQSR